MVQNYARAPESTEMSECKSSAKLLISGKDRCPASPLLLLSNAMLWLHTVPTVILEDRVATVLVT